MNKSKMKKIWTAFVVICSMIIMNGAGIEAKMSSPEPVIGMTENQFSNTDENLSESSNINEINSYNISSLIREETIEENIKKEVNKTPAPLEQKKNYNSQVPKEKNNALTQDDLKNGFAEPEDDFVPGEIVVCFKDECSDSSISKIISKQKVVKTKDIYKEACNSEKRDFSVDESKLKSLKKEIGKYYVVTISGKSKKDVLNTVAELNKEPSVKYAEPNYIFEPCEVPNDYNNFDLWNMDRIQMPDVWDSYPGARIDVGVLDTGIDAGHPDLKNNVDTALGWNCALKSNTDTLDYDSHGTHVAGTIGAEGNNSIGVVGVNPLARLVPIKICFGNDNRNSNSDLMTEGILHAAKNNISVCNMSYSVPDSKIFRDAIKKYGENGGTFIVAADNKGKCIDDLSAYKSLAELNNVIIVANSDKGLNDKEDLSLSSNYGHIVHVAAPGTNIYSTVPTSKYASGYGLKGGTSMAAPHVTGVVSLLKAINPDMKPFEIRQVIIDRADFVPKLEGKVLSGGRLNAKNTVGGFLKVIPNSNETMADAIKRSLGSRSGSDIKMLKLVGVYGLIDGGDSSDSANAVLPNLEYADVSQYKGDLKKYSFYGCKNLTMVILPEENVQLPSFCFMKCSKLNTIYRLNGERKINEADFTGLVSSSTGHFAAQTQCFERCLSLKTIKLPNSTKLRFSQNVFSECANLDTVYIETQTPVTGEADLTEFTELLPLVFKGTGIASVKLPKDVEVKKQAFKDCIKLKSIQVHPKQTEMFSAYDDSFYNVDEKCKIFMNQVLYKSSSDYYRAANAHIAKEINSLLVWPKTNEKINDTINYYLNEAAVSASAIKNLVIFGDVNMGNASNIASANVLPNLEVVDMSSFTGSLGRYTFYKCRNLETVIRSSNLSNIPGQCFMYCDKLATIMESDKYPKIWNEADLSDLTGGIAVDTQGFDECLSLLTVKFPSVSIGFAGSFSKCTSLSTIYKEGGEKQDGTFDLTGISTLWEDWGHNLKYTAVCTVKLPRGVTIPDYCFYNCSNLKEILFERIQIYTIGIGSKAFYGVNPYCEAYMDPMLVYNDSFQIKRSDTDNIKKIAY